MSNKVRLPGWRCIVYEMMLNGWKVLVRTKNDFSLWRLIEYPWCTKALDLRRGETVIDVGSGTATYPHMLSKEGVNVVVIELDEERVRWQRDKRRATERPGDGKFYAVVGDATRLPLRSGSIDKFAAISALEHIPDDVAVGQEIGRVLSENGTAVLTLPFTSTERTGFFEGIRKFARVGPNAFVQEGKTGSFFRFYTRSDIERVYIEPAQADVTRERGFGRSILNGRYHETKLTRYWRKFILKDWLLALTVHPLEEWFDRSDPLYVMLKLVKRSTTPTKAQKKRKTKAERAEAVQV